MSMKATCRCGADLAIPADGSDRVVCGHCGSKVRLRRNGAAPTTGDGFIRFYCPCGRRLKVPADQSPTHGKCPDCARIVPVPMVGIARLEARTEELRAEEHASLDRWAADHQEKGSRVPRDTGPRHDPEATPLVQRGPASLMAEVVPPKAEAGLRLCPKCKRPVHLGADSCRHCGTSVPRR